MSAYHDRLDRLDRIGTLPEPFLWLLDRLARSRGILESYRVRHHTARFRRFYGLL